MDNNIQDICRVCRSEGSTDKPLYHPCRCTGSVKYIHKDCLVQWLKYSEKEYCELCNYRFSFTTSRSSRIISSYKVFETDCPIGTIKRKPSLPLTSTTRNLAKQSDNAVLDIESSSSGDDEKTFKNGIFRLRRSATAERLDNSFTYEGKSIGRFEPPMTNQTPQDSSEDADCEEEEDDYGDDDLDDFPLPPPPETLTSSLSCLSLDSLPPPPSEFLDNSDDFKIADKTESTQSLRRISNAKPISPVVPPNLDYLNDNLFEYLTRNNGNKRNSCTSTSTSTDSTTSSNINNNSSRVSTSNSNHYQTTLKRDSINRITGSTLPSPMHNQSPSPVSITTITQQRLQSQHSYSDQLYHESPKPNDSKNEANKEPIYQQIPAHFVSNQISSSTNVTCRQPNSQHYQYPQMQQHQQLLGHPNANICQPSNPAESIDGPIYQEVPKTVAQNVNYGNNSNNNKNNRESLSQRSSNGLNLPFNNTSSPVIISTNPISPGSRPSSIVSTPTNNCKTSTFNKVEIAASFNYPPPMSQRNPMKGPLPPPPEIFLRDIHRVMDKKWKVAQQLSVDTNQTIDQLIFGFRGSHDYYYYYDYPQNQQPSEAPIPPYPSQTINNHYEVPPNMSHYNHNYNQNYQSNPYQQNVSPCQRIDELSECNNAIHSSPNSSASSSSSGTSNSSMMSSPYYEIQERDIPVLPPPPILRCTNSSLFDKTSIRGKSAPPPPPRRSDKTRLSGRNQLRN